MVSVSLPDACGRVVLLNLEARFRNREEGLLEKSSATGGAALTRLREFGDGHPLIGSVRGYGYMIGVEFVHENGDPNGEACQKVLEFCLKKELILIGCGLERNVIRFIPPLIATEGEIEDGIDILVAGAEALL